MFVRNCWYVAGWDIDVPAKEFLKRTIINVPVVFWRDNAGSVIALEDRCCHRGAPLSKGRLEGCGDQIRCMYHGLLYDRTGECIAAPAQVRIPPRARVRSFHVVERHRWIWIWMGEPEKANQDAIPDTQWLDHPEWRSLPGYLQYDVNYLLIADNLLDFSHLPYLHPTTVGGSPDYAAVVPKLERGTRSVRMTKWVLNTRPPAYAAKYGRYKEHDRVDRWMYYEFIAPGILLMDSGMMPAGTGNQDAHRNDALAFRGCQALTPETDTSTHYFFAHPHNFLIDSPDVTEQIHQSIIQAFEEDRDMIRAQQQNLRRDPGFEMVPLGVDAALTHYRRIIETLRATEASDT